jgi:hypothetical protein
MNQYSHFEANSTHLITKADLGKVYIDMDGKVKTIDKRIVGGCLVAYVVTNKNGKSEIIAHNPYNLFKLPLVYQSQGKHTASP